MTVYCNYMKVTQHRAQLFLDTELYGWYKRIAREEDKSFAQIAREAMEQMRERREKTKKRRRQDLHKQIMALSGSIREKDGVTDVSVNHDKYLGEALYEEIVRNRRR